MPDRGFRRATSAAWALAAVLAVAAFCGDRDAPPACTRPVAAQSGEDPEAFTRRVLCGGAGPAHPVRGPARLLFGRKLDLNCASPRALEVIPGIGPARAEAIRSARCQAPFARLEDVARAHGIGPVTLARLAGVGEVVHPSTRAGACDPGCP